MSERGVLKLVDAEKVEHVTDDTHPNTHPVDHVTMHMITRPRE
jgi:hypothetical protein